MTVAVGVGWPQGARVQVIRRRAVVAIDSVLRIAVVVRIGRFLVGCQPVVVVVIVEIVGQIVRVSIVVRGVPPVVIFEDGQNSIAVVVVVEVVGQGVAV